MKTIHIGILSIGSGVGQSVIESLIIHNSSFITHGIGNNPLAFGASACDFQHIIPSFRSADYVDVLIELCLDNSIEILIPGSDDEALILSLNLERFIANKIKVIVSDPRLMIILRDKFKLADTFNSEQNVFVQSETLTSILKRIENNEDVFPLIAKPKDGFASKGIKIILNREDLVKVETNDVLQTCLIPCKEDSNYPRYIQMLNQHINPQISEYSYQVIFDTNSRPVHRMVSVNSLNNGVPIEIEPIFDEMLWVPIETIIIKLSELGAKGPINIQGRWTDSGFQAFEINARFTGITSLRAQLGFNEVLYCLELWCFSKSSQSMSIHPRKIGLRQTCNRSISITHPILKTHSFKNGVRVKPRLLITGATGYLGYTLIEKFKDNYEVLAYGRDKEKLIYLKETFPTIRFLDDQELTNLNFGNLDVIIHAAFLRPNKEAQYTYQSSIDLTQWLLEKCVHYQIPKFIFISSASIDRENYTLKSNYTLAKYSCERMLDLIAKQHTHLRLYSLRLDTLFGANPMLIPLDMVSKMILSALKNQVLILKSNKVENRISLQEASQTIYAIANNDQLFSGVVSVRTKKPHTTHSIARSIQCVAKESFNTDIPIVLENDVIPDSNFEHKSSDLEEDILALFNHFENYKTKFTIR